MEVSADNSFPDFRSPLPAPRSPFPVLVTSVLVENSAFNISKTLGLFYYRDDDLNFVLQVYSDGFCSLISSILEGDD